MILIVTHKLDYTADFVIDVLNNRKIPYLRLNCEDIMSSELEVNIGKDTTLSILKESHFSSIWFRRTMLPTIDLPQAEKIYLLKEFEYLLKNIFSTLNGKWLSDPFFVYRAENKLLQLKTARQIGFTVPETLISTNVSAVKEFAKAQQSIIVKPLYSGRIESGGTTQFMFTSKVSDELLSELDKYDLTPCIFQQEIKKKIELRITVVGKRVFSAQVDSQQLNETKIDWRKKKITFETFQLPPSIEAMCLQLVEALGLRFGAIDMILTPDGEYIFLEINPNGQWVWIETETGLPISEALIDELIAIEK